MYNIRLKGKVAVVGVEVFIKAAFILASIIDVKVVKTNTRF